MLGSPLEPRIDSGSENGLSLFFATCCFVDLFGVFPVIALPRAIIECGWVGFPLAFVVFSIQIYTAIMLGRCWILCEAMSSDVLQKTRYPYAAMAELALGKFVGQYVNFLIGLTVFCGSVPNLLVVNIFIASSAVAAQNLELIGLQVSEYQVDLPFCYWILILGAVMCPLTWFGSPKDLKWLGCISVVVVMTSSALTWYCLLDSPSPSEAFVPNPDWTSIAIAFGILAFQFDIHPMVLTVQMDMRDKTQLRPAIMLAFLVSGGLFVVTTIICYSLFGMATRYNVLQGLPASTALYVDFMLATLQIVMSTVIGANPLLQGLEDLLGIGSGVSWKSCLLRTSVVIAIVFVGEVIPRFDLIMSLFGAVLMSQLMFIIPPLLYTRLRVMQTTVRPALLSIPKRLFGYGSISQVLRPQYSPLLGYHARADLSDVRQTSSGPGPYALESLDSIDQYADRRPPVRRSYLSSISEFFTAESSVDVGPLKTTEKLTSGLLVLLGLTAAGVSTFFAISETLEFAELATPCIVNVTLATRLIHDLL